MMYNISPGNDPVYPTSGSSSTAPRNPILYPLHSQIQHQLPPIMIPLHPPPPSMQPFPGDCGGGGSDYDEFPRRDERFPQWSNQETRELIEIRAQLEWDFTASKRNKNLWEMVAVRLRDKGYRRTAEQCKCKWKNLVTKYKGQEIGDLENGRKCPFFDEIHAVFQSRDNIMHQAQHDPEAGLMKGKKRVKNVYEEQSFEDFSEEEYDGEETEMDYPEMARSVPKGKAPAEKRRKAEKRVGSSNTNSNGKYNVLSSLQEILKNYFLQQQMIDTEWRESMERRAKEKEIFEREWRQTMENLEKERLAMERAWREKEEQRKIREESRAEQRDALLTTLLNKLLRDESK